VSRLGLVGSAVLGLGFSNSLGLKTGPARPGLGKFVMTNSIIFNENKCAI